MFNGPCYYGSWPKCSKHHKLNEVIRQGFFQHKMAVFIRKICPKIQPLVNLTMFLCQSIKGRRQNGKHPRCILPDMDLVTLLSELSPVYSAPARV